MRVLRSIQYLRVLAALMVVTFHVTIRLGNPVPVLAAGVDVFFVISGFIMWTVTWSRPVSPGRFLFHRLVRIVPSYWFITLLMVAVSLAAPGVFPNLLTPLDHVLLSLLFIPHASPNGGSFPVLVPGWTLTYEMFFYALFAASLLAPSRYRAWAVSAALLALVLAGWLTAPSDAALVTYTSPQLIEFAGGLWLGVLTTRERLPSRPWAAALVLGGCVGFVAAFLFPSQDPGFHVVTWGIPALCLVAGSLGWELAGSIPDSPALMKLADASYAIYLSHGLVVSSCWKLLGGSSGPSFGVACLIASAVVGIAFHDVIEMPMTHRLRRLSGLKLRAARATSP